MIRPSQRGRFHQRVQKFAAAVWNTSLVKFYEPFERRSHAGECGRNSGDHRISGISMGRDSAFAGILVFEFIIVLHRELEGRFMPLDRCEDRIVCM
jgi:hypothetical protein